MAQRSMTIEAERASGSRTRVIQRVMLAGGAMSALFVVLGVIAIQAWEYSNSVAFCTTACHDVHPEEPVANQDSYHAQVKCTECHMGRVSTLRGIVLKSSHFRHLPEMVFDNYERPLLSVTMRPASESCERCHSPPAFHDDIAREIERFLPDADNTAKRIYLLLRTGTGGSEQGQGYGIHWHVSNPVEYIATSDDKQQIRWVRTILPDGSTVEYNDVNNPLSPEEIASAEKRIMDCVDCHNRIGHPFPSPEELVDEAMAEGRLSTGLPFAKAELLALLDAEYGSQAEALAAADSLEERYRAAYPGIAVSHAREIEGAVELAKELVLRLVFEEPGITWQSFFDNSGHQNSAGCFRCHDGRHVSSDGTAIRLQCNLCHSIPVTVDANEDPPEMPIAARQAPPSHLQIHFVRNHGLQLDGSCAGCHGEIDFGRDDSGFCANSSCHGRDWPVLDLSAAFSHPVRLEGKHASAACQDCHNGAREIAYECAQCHESPGQSHYGTACQDCHTPDGFELASGGEIQHPVALEGSHALVDCASCHVSDQSLSTECATCHIPPQAHAAGACDTCHTPAAWAQTAFDHSLSAFPLLGSHQSVACGNCHTGSAYDGTPHECYACHQQNDVHGGRFGADCAQCHSLDGWRGATLDHNLTTFPLAGAHLRATCAQCHPGNAYGGTPRECYACHQQNDVHGGQFGGDCAQCHSLDGWRGATLDHNLTTFPLAGAHLRATCTQCHPGNAYGGTPRECSACHQQNDVHGGQFGGDCAQCHSLDGWQGASLDHNLTAFPLAGAHLRATCTQCHPGHAYSGTPQECSACHQQNDVHAGQFGGDCAQCHSLDGWQGASLDHNLTAFPLTGAHTGAACAQCHVDGTFQGTPRDCNACHSEPAFHAGVLGPDCAACHDSSAWKPAWYGTAHTFPFGHGESGSSSCQTCHPDSLAVYTCYGCHEHEPTRIEREHREEGISNLADCARCHPTGREEEDEGDDD